MPYIINGPRVNRHVSFTQEENDLLCKRAAKVGMEVVPFIKQEALHGTVKGFPLAVLSRHANAIGEIVKAARELAARPHPDRWKYEADLEEMNDKLDKILEIERTIQEGVRRRMI